MSISRFRYTLPLRIRSIFRRSRVEAELQEELQGHLERLVDEYLRSGLSPVEARYAAKCKMADVEPVKENIRDVRRVSLIDETSRDVRYAFRIFRATPTFTMVAALTLALGIGATTAVFSVIDAVLLRPLPFDYPEELVRLYATKGGTIVGGPSVADVRDVALAARSLTTLAAYDEWRKNVSTDGDDRPEQMIVGLVPREYFEALHVAPLYGRFFTNDENTLGRHYVAAISERLWRDRFGAAADVLGKTLRINDEPYTIVAVIPDVIPDWLAVRGLPVMVWTPYPQPAEVFSESGRSIRGNYTVGRLRAGVSIGQARAEVAQLAAQLALTHPADRSYGMTLVPLADSRVGTLRPILGILAASVMLVLLIVCANLANLVLARNASRERELVLRTALGAGPSRIARQLLVETMLLSLIGGLLGLAVAMGACAALSQWHPATLPQLEHLTMDARVVGFAFAVSLLTGLAFGLPPAWSTARVDPATVLTSGARGSSGTRQQQRVRSVLAVTEVALALVLVTATALLAESMLNLGRQDLGFDPRNLLKAHVYIAPARYRDADAVTRFADRFAEAVRALPGVRFSTVVIGYPPVADRWTQKLIIDGRPPVDARDTATTFFTAGDEQFLQTLGVPLVRGRNLAASDGPGGPAVGLVNEAFMRRYFPAGDPIGARIHLLKPLTAVDSARTITIVGVFRDIVNDGVGAPVQPQVVGLYRQLPEFNSEFKDIIVRSRSDPLALVSPMRTTLYALDPDMPLAEVATFREVVMSLAGGLTYTALLLGAFAALGLTLAAIGIYGLVAYAVTQRTPEIGIRMAIGASPSAVLWLVINRGLTLGVAGAGIGILGSLAMSRLLSEELFGVSAVDPATLSVTGLTLLLVAVLASAIPAWRATRIDPAHALRSG